MIPTVGITPRTLISTEGDSLAWTFTLDKPVPEGGLNVNFVTTQVTESTPGDVSFNLEASTGIINFNELVANDVSLGSTVTFAPGVTEAILVLDTVADDIPETDEIGSYTIADREDYRANPNQSTVTAIFADRTVVTLTTDEVNVTEGDTFAWNFNLNRPAPVGGLTLSLPITFNNDPEPGDVIYNVEGSTNIEDFGFITQDDVSVGFTLTIPEGETEATLLSQAVVDDIAEFDEIFTTVLADGNDYVANPVNNQVVTTIVEDGVAPPSSAPVVSITPEALISTEGDTFAWNFTLDKPVPKGGLTLSLPITQNNDPEPGDVEYNVAGSTGITDFDFIVEDNISIGFSVTLEEGVTSATLVSQAVADNLEEGDEIFTTILNDGNNYRANPVSREVVTTIVETSTANEISGTTKDDNLYGTNAAEIISGGRGDDNISGNGGGDTLIGGRGDDDIYGGFEADTIEGGRGDDFIFGNGGNDLIDSGLGFDTVFLGAEETTVILDKGKGFDTIFNFQLGSTKLEVSSLDNLNFTDSDSGAEIFLEGDKLAVVAGQSAHTFSSNKDMIFAV